MKNIRLFKDNFILLDPSKWPRRELLSRLLAICIIACFLYAKLTTFYQFPGSLDGATRFFSGINQQMGYHQFGSAEITFLWLMRLIIWFLETGILVLYVAAYLSRMAAVSVARGFMEVVFPFIPASLPIVISFAPYNFHEHVPYTSGSYVHYYTLTALFMILGGFINLLGLFTLRKAFTIMSEARMLVTNGIFRKIRHPLYLGHFIMFFGSLLLRLHWYTIVLYTGFILAQIIRARIEEKKLETAFTAYTAYKEQTGMFLPFSLKSSLKK